MPDLRWWMGAAVAVAMGVSAREARAQLGHPSLEDDQLEPTDGAPSPSPTTPPPYEPPAPHFGARGELVITSASVVGLSSQQFDASQARYFSVNFSPGLDWFVVRDVSIGVTGDASYSNDQGYDPVGSVVRDQTTTFSAGPRVGVNLSLGERWSFYPRLALGLESIHHQETLVTPGPAAAGANVPVPPATTRMGAWVSVFAPLLFHPRPHLFVGFGPQWFQDFGPGGGGPGVGGQSTSLGAGLVVGGWWRGAVDARDLADAPPPPESVRPHRFGLAHQVVLDGNLDLAGRWTGYAGTHSSVTTWVVTPGVDYFVADHVSIGGAISVASSSTTTADPAPVTTSAFGEGLSARIGVDLPLGPWLSVYPRASIGVMTEQYDEKAAAPFNTSETENVATVGLYAPLLVHPASHLFAGFGPSLWRDLVRSVQGSSVKNASTTLGASLIVGGWIDG